MKGMRNTTVMSGAERDSEIHQHLSNIAVSLYTLTKYCMLALARESCGCGVTSRRLTRLPCESPWMAPCSS